MRQQGRLQIPLPCPWSRLQPWLLRLLWGIGPRYSLCFSPTITAFAWRRCAMLQLTRKVDFQQFQLLFSAWLMAWGEDVIGSFRLSSFLKVGFVSTSCFVCCCLTSDFRSYHGLISHFTGITASIFPLETTHKQSTISTTPVPFHGRRRLLNPLTQLRRRTAYSMELYLAHVYFASMART